MAVKFLTKVGNEDIYRITTSTGRNIKVSILGTPDPEDITKKLWNAYVWFDNTGEWKLLMNESEITCTLPEFVQKVDLILKED